MTSRFLAFLPFVLAHETTFARNHDGDYAYAIAEHDPDDPGGTTKFGIDQRSHPDVDIEHLTLDRARQIYDRAYWGPSQAEVLPKGVGEVTTYHALTDTAGVPLTLTDTALRQIVELPVWIKPRVFGGSPATNLAVIIAGRRSL